MAYNMKGFSGFGNSPAKQTKFPNSPGAINRAENKEQKIENLKNDHDVNDDGVPQTDPEGYYKKTGIKPPKKKKKHPLGIEDPAELEKLYKTTENPNNKGRQ